MSSFMTAVLHSVNDAMSGCSLTLCFWTRADVLCCPDADRWHIKAPTWPNLLTHPRACQVWPCQEWRFAGMQL